MNIPYIIKDEKKASQGKLNKTATVKLRIF